ncbi:MAG: hypothetical protein U1F30_14810 [Steroidobacteraceae bacterium]
MGDAARATVRINGRDVPELLRHPAGAGGGASVSIPWPALEFPA